MMYAPQDIPRTVDGAYQYFDMTQIDEHLDSKMLTGYDQTFAAIEQFDPGYRDAMEQPDLAVDFGFHESTRLDLGLDGTLRTTEERYLAMYWSLVHPFFPVVHRPSFDMQTASPLLRAAVLALGAQASLDEDDKANARACHERCIKVLKMVCPLTQCLPARHRVGSCTDINNRGQSRCCIRTDCAICKRPCSLKYTRSSSPDEHLYNAPITSQTSTDS